MDRGWSSFVEKWNSDAHGGR